MSWNELLEKSALEQAALVKTRAVSSEELVRLYLERIHRLNPQLNAFVSIFDGAAVREARRKDALIKRGDPLPPFHGVPIGIKDLNMVRGRMTRWGSRAIGLWSPVDCRTTSSLRRGGFVILGKLATSELGAMPVTEPDIHPPARNPWDSTRTPGGSSGGSAAAVAAAMLPVAHASDGGGSIRIPASLCHLYGIKASRGRIANAFGFPDKDILYTCGPLTRTVADAAAMLDVLAGLDVGKPHWLPPPPERFQALAERRPGPLRIHVSFRTPLVEAHPEIEAAVRTVARTLEGLGHHVEEVTAPEGTVEEFLPVWQKLVATIPVFKPDRLQPVTRWLWTEGRKVDRAHALQIQQRLAQRILASMAQADLWLTPTISVVTPRVGEWRDLPPTEAFFRAAQLGIFTAPSNITGAPAASIPMGTLEGRWPIGAQLVGRLGEDAMVLAVSRQLEEAMPWRQRWPGLAGRA